MHSWKDTGYNPFCEECSRESTKGKQQRNSGCYRRMLAVALCAIQTYLYLFMANVVACLECSVVFLKCIFTSFHSIKLKVVCRELGGVCEGATQVATSFHLIFGERFLQELLVSIIFFLQHS